MEELENKLNSILNNPQMMQQIMQMAQNFAPAASAPEPDAPKPQQSPVFPDFDPAMLQKLSGLAGKAHIDPKQQRLLQALGPYLNKQRLSKLERAMRAARMAGVATAFLGTGR